MTNTVTTTEHHLSKSLEKKADAIAVRVSSVEKEMEQICMDVATDCEGLEEGTIDAYLARAFPETSNRGNRYRYLYAGLMLHESLRRRSMKPAWTVAAEAYSLPPAGHEWFFSQEKLPTRNAIRAYKYNLPEAVQKRKERAQHKGSNGQLGQKTSSQSQHLPPQTDDSNNTQQQQHTTSVVDSPVRSSDGLQPECSEVPDLHERLVSYEEEQDADSMGTRTYDPNDASDKFDRIEQLIEDIKDLHRELFDGGLSEGQWQDLSQQYGSLKYFADIRWERRREEMGRRRREFNRLLDEASMGIPSGSSEVSQLSES
jgi:hypothetical protein